MKGVEFVADCGQDEAIQKHSPGKIMAEIGIFVGTMYGNSLLVAEEAGPFWHEMGHKATGI